MRGAMVAGVFLIAAAALAQTPAIAPAKAADKSSPPPKQMNGLFGGAADSKIEGPIVTQIFSDAAFFDSAKNMGIFTGRVRVLDPRFGLQADKLTVFLTKGEDQGLERAIADGNVAMVRERPNPKGGAPERAVGKSDHAVYTANDGNVELTGTPKVQQGPNMHVATSADTVMVITQAGQLTTRGPSRTEIHQAPDANKTSPSPAPKQ